MTRHFRKTSGGFLLIEVMVAILIVAMGILGLAKLEAMVVGSAGEAKSRSAAMALARSQIDTLRNSVLKTQYTSNLATGSKTDTVNGISFTTTWTVTQPDSNYEDRLVQVSVSWIDQSGSTQTITLDSVIAWNDPVLGELTQNSTNTNVIAPTGAANRGKGSYAPGQTVSVETGSDNITRLVNANGETILYLDPSNDQAQQFTVIYGRVYFDQTVASNKIPASTNVYVRLSSEGECIYDHASGNLLSLPTGASGSSLKYKYFSYRCYVGPGWYGNVGVTVINDNTTPTICVGDPKFTDTSFTATPTATESTIRSYRGFRLSGSTYISTGVAAGSIYGDDGTVTTKAGKPKPSDYTGVYGIIAGSTADFFHQDFLVTKVQGQMSCSGQMQQISNTDTFSPNAGKYYCINPDNWSTDSTGNQCPANWFSTSTNNSCTISVSGSFNPPVTPDPSATSTTSVNCTMSDGSSCSCQTTTGTSNYSCSMAASASQTATISASMISTGWSSAITQTCVPTSACVAPTSTSSLEYQCTQSSCNSGYQRTQSRTLTWSAYSNLNSTVYNNSNGCTNAKPANTTTSHYQCTAIAGNGGSSNYVIQVSTLSYGSWQDTSSTCVATSAVRPDDTSTTKYTWLAGNGANGCASGTQQLQAQSQNSTTTQTCTRTTSALACSSNVSSFNIDSSTATCN